MCDVTIYFLECVRHIRNSDMHQLDMMVLSSGALDIIIIDTHVIGQCCVLVDVPSRLNHLSDYIPADTLNVVLLSAFCAALCSLAFLLCVLDVVLLVATFLILVLVAFCPFGRVVCFLSMLLVWSLLACFDVDLCARFRCFFLLYVVMLLSLARAKQIFLTNQFFRRLAGLALMFSSSLLLQILAYAIYNNQWPMLSALMYVLAPMPCMFFGRGTTEYLLSCDGGGWIDAAKFLTGASAVGSIAIPIILRHAHLISTGAMLIEFMSFFIFVGTVMCFHRANLEDEW
ncbi:vacuolar protein sorting-associated protein 55 [Tanacetum coccineum]